MSELEDWLHDGLARTVDGSELYVGAETHYGEPVKVTLRDTKGEEVFVMYADEAGKLMLDLMGSLCFGTDRSAFEQRIKEIRVELVEWRSEEEVKRRRDAHAFSVFELAYVVLNSRDRMVVDMLVSRDQKIEKLEKELKDVE